MDLPAYTPESLVEWADKIDRRLGPIYGRDADALARLLRATAARMRQLKTDRDDLDLALHAKIEHMVNRFLGWPLPKDFAPDNGVSVNRPNYAPEVAWAPSGTNLLDARQATEMVRYILEGAPYCEGFAWLIEAPGQRYLAARAVVGHKFHWTQDHSVALRFFSEEQADLAMMAIRELDQKLFGFAETLGDARPVCHGWLNE